MSPGWQISRKTPHPANDVQDAATDESSSRPSSAPQTDPQAVPSAPQPPRITHDVDRSARALDTERRLVSTQKDAARKARARKASAKAAAKHAAAKAKPALPRSPEPAAPAKAAKKAGTRRKAREMAMQMLFQADLGKQTADQVRASFWAAAEQADSDTRGFAEDLFHVATARAEEIDTLIETHSAHWRLARMAAVDRNLLRAATAELLGFPGTPVPIVINESLEIARRYSAPESINFLNGVLDAISRSRK